MDEPLPLPVSGDRPGAGAPVLPPGAGGTAGPSPSEEEMSNALIEGTRALAPRRRSRAEADEGETANPDVEILALTGRLQELIARRRAEEEQRTASPAATRLRPRAPRAVAPAEEAAVAVLDDARAALPRMAPRRHHSVPTAEERLEAAAGRWGQLGGRLLAFMVLPAAAFVIGRMTAPAPTRSPSEPGQAVVLSGTRPAPAPNTAPPAPPRWTPETLNRLEEAFTALRPGGDPGPAVTILRELRAANGALPGLDLLLADLHLRAGRAQEAVPVLLPLFRADPPVAPACDQLGFLSARGRRMDEAAGYFAAAAGADPLSGLYFYHWGEAARRQGKGEEAILHFEQALRRRVGLGSARPTPPDASLRLNLTRIEAGRGAEVRRENEERLRNLPPNTPELGQALVTLAAVDLQEGRFTEAGARLGQARDPVAALRGSGGASGLEVLLNDYFFRAFAGRPELAGVIPPGASEADARRVAALTNSAEVCFVDP